MAKKRSSGGLSGSPSEHKARGRELAKTARYFLSRARKSGASRAKRCEAAIDAAVAAGQVNAEAVWGGERGAGLLVRRAGAAVKKACGCR